MVEQNHKWLLKGDIICVMTHKDGTIERRTMQNVIVDVASLLMAQLMKETSGIDGIMTLAVGTGDPGWDLQNPPSATSAQTQLENELDRKVFERSYYVDGAGVESLTRTNRVAYETKYDETEAVGALVEMGLFGGVGATTPGAGDMCNYHTFPVWNKSATSTLTITWLLTF